MKGSIRNKAVLFSILIILFSSVTVMIGAVAVSIRQINFANSEHLDRAMGSVHRQFTDELQRMRTVFKGFAEDPMNNYFIYNSIDISYFLWQDNASILQLSDQINADAMGFYYRSPEDAADASDRLRMFRKRGEPLYQLNRDGGFDKVSLDQFGAPQVTQGQRLAPIPFKETHTSAPRFSIKIRKGTPVLIANFELKRLTGEHLGYFVFEKSVGLDTASLNSELGVQITLYDLSGTPAKAENVMTTLAITDAYRQQENRTLSGAAGETYNARVAPLLYGDTPIGFISVGIPTAQTVERISQTVMILSILSLIISVPIVVVGGMLVSRYVQPIITLTEVSKEMAKGKLDHQLEVHDRDEIGVLASSFADMRNVIQQKIEELQLVNSDLDKRVEKRSAELARQSDMLDALLDVLRDAVYFKDKEGRYTRVNQTYAKKLGKIVSSSIIGKKDSEIAAGTTSRIRTAEDTQILKSGMIVRDAPGISFDEGSRRIEVIWNKQPLLDAEGEVVGMFAVAREVGPNTTAIDFTIPAPPIVKETSHE